MKEWKYSNEQWTQLPRHVKHLPLFTRHFDLVSFFFRFLWRVFLTVSFKFWVRLEIKGDWKKVYSENPRLLIISNHASHLDAVSIAAAIPFSMWQSLYIAAAKDYFFGSPVFMFFSQHCLGAIPIDRKDKKGEAVELCITLLTKLNRIWLILFPEGTRSPDGKMSRFKKGVSIFALETGTPILFLYLEGNSELWPKGRHTPKRGRLVLHIGPVHQPDKIDVIDSAYKSWARKINPNLQESES